MEKNQNRSFDLTVITEDKAAEKIVLNSRFQRVAASRENEAVFRLPEGLYSVKVAVGSQYQEKSVWLNKNQEVYFNSILFSSPAPLQHTKSEEQQLVESKNHSHKIHCSIGKGSEIYIFMRDLGKRWLPADKENRRVHPLKGLTLMDKDGKLLVNYIDYADQDFPGSSKETWAACNIELSPGIYRLQLEIQSGGNADQRIILQQTIVASPGWQTQIFVVKSSYEAIPGDITADLGNSSVFMEKLGFGFEPNKIPNDERLSDSRLIEIIRQGLKNQRNIIPKDTRENLLNGLFDNPMLGIYGGHLLTIDRKAEQWNLQRLVNRLRELLSDPHPDVEALAVKHNMPANFRYDVFPMLYNSWKYIVEASVTDFGIVPSGSLPAKYSGQFRDCNIWLIWGKDHENDDSSLLKRIKSYKAEKSFLNTRSAKKEMSFPIEEMNDESYLSLVQYLGVPKSKVEEVLNDENLRPSPAVEENEPGVDADIVVEDDIQKGKWGGLSEVNHRKISATVKPSIIPKLYKVVITVESTSPEHPLAGIVKFYLHDTFLNPEPTIRAKEGKAVLKLSGVWGSFTVGAEADEGQTRLELDLAQIPGVPEEFKEY